jgi:hypothetical protein
MRVRMNQKDVSNTGGPSDASKEGSLPDRLEPGCSLGNSRRLPPAVSLYPAARPLPGI